MYFESVKIENFKVIQDMQIEFKPGVNLLIGDNGVGKTTILEALTVVLGGFLSGIAGVSTKGILQTDVRILSHKISDASSAIQYMAPVSISCTMDIEGEKYEWARVRESESGDSRTKITNRKIINYARRIANDMDCCLPLLSYMGTTRVSQPKREDFGATLKKKLDDRRCGYIGCLDSALNIKTIKDWCLKMEMVAYHKQKQVPEYEAFKKMISSFMRKMGDMELSPTISYSRAFEDLTYSEGDNTLPVSYLSAGYQSLLWMVMDLAYRLAILNPGQTDYENTTGVVMIDELDMHLHPKWQWNILAALEEAFPNVQFIIATHSPIIISSCKNEKLIRIGADQEVGYPESAYAYSIEDVLELRQGSQGIPMGVKKSVIEFEDALNEEKYDTANEILQEMILKYGRDNREVKNAMMELELEMGEE